MDSSGSSRAITCPAKLAVLVLIGLPGSGKTTLCLSLPHFLGNKYHIIHICYDQVIPFKENRNWEENLGSWKEERAKVVQAADTLLSNLIGAINSVMYTYEVKTFQDKHKITPNTNLLCSNENAVDCMNNKYEEMHFNENMNSYLRSDCVLINNRGHYTILNSFSDIISICDKISECDLQNELFVVCVDDNCYYRSMRKEWWNLAAKYELPFCIVTLQCDVDKCARRVKERLHSSTFFYSPNVPENVISRMNKHLEYPDGDMYSWEKYSIVIDSNSLNLSVDTTSKSYLLSDRGLTLDRFSLESLKRIKQLISSSLLEPAKCLNKEAHSSSNPVTPSIIHIVDLALRKVVSKSDPTIRSLVNIKRKKILESLRNGKLIIPSDMLVELNGGCGHKVDGYVATLIEL